MPPFSSRYHLLSHSATGIILWSGWIWESGFVRASTCLNHSLSSALLRVLYFEFANRWSYLHEPDDKAASVSCPGEVKEELIKLPVCPCQLQWVNFIRASGPKDICTCYLQQLPDQEKEAEKQNILFDNDMEMMVFISTHSFEILVLL